MKEVDLIAEDLCRDPRLRIALVTETFPPEVNGVAMTLGRMVDGLLVRGHRLQLIRPRQHASESAAATTALDLRLMRGVAIPRYEGLKFGLPARNTLVRMWTASRPDLVHVATEGPLGWSAISAARHLRLPVSSDYHTHFDHYSQHYGFRWLRQPVSSYLRRFHNRCLATYVPAPDLAATLRADGYHNVEVISRGVDGTLFSPNRRDTALRAQWSLRGDELAILSVGRIAPEKILGLTLRCFDAIRSRLPQSRLVMVGDGPDRAALQAQRPDIVFCGMRSGEDLAAHYASGDLFLFPSLTETFGNVTLEAMAAGRCVVAFDYAAAHMLFDNGRNGVAAPKGDEEAFIDAAVQLALAPGAMRTIAHRARARALESDWDDIHDSFASALARVARQSGTTMRDVLVEQGR